MDSLSHADQSQYALDAEVATQRIEQLISETSIAPVDVSGVSSHRLEVRMRHWRIWFTDGGQESFAALQVLPDGSFEYFSTWETKRFGTFVDAQEFEKGSRTDFIRSYVEAQFYEGLEIMKPARRPFNELPEPESGSPRPGPR